MTGTSPIDFVFICNVIAFELAMQRNWSSAVRVCEVNASSIGCQQAFLSAIARVLEILNLRHGCHPA